MDEHFSRVFHIINAAVSLAKASHKAKPKSREGKTDYASQRAGLQIIEAIFFLIPSAAGSFAGSGPWTASPLRNYFFLKKATSLKDTPPHEACWGLITVPAAVPWGPPPAKGHRSSLRKQILTWNWGWTTCQLTGNENPNPADTRSLEDGAEVGKTATSGKMEWDAGRRKGTRGCNISSFWKLWRKSSL